MRVVQNCSGWDIALGMVFSDQETAETIAKRLTPILPSILRDAMDGSMRERKAAKVAPRETIVHQVSLGSLSNSPGTNQTPQPTRRR